MRNRKLRAQRLAVFCVAIPANPHWEIYTEQQAGPRAAQVYMYVCNDQDWVAHGSQQLGVRGLPGGKQM